MRAANLAASASPPEGARGLESNTKKASTLVRKLRELSEEKRQALIDEMSKLNLRLFVSEVAAAIAEAKLRGSDVAAATAIASAMHQVYADFSRELMPLVHKAAVSPAAPGESESDRAARLARKRSSLRLLGELYMAGLSTDFAQVVGALKECARQDAESAKAAADGSSGGAALSAELPNLAAVLGFAKNCAPLLLAPFRSILVAADGAPVAADAADAEQHEWAEPIIFEKEARLLHALLGNYFKMLSKLALAEHARVRRQERSNRRALQSSGELSEEMASKYDTVRRAFDRIWAGVVALAELLRVAPPVLPTEADDDEEAARRAAAASADAEYADDGVRRVEGFEGMEVWEDEEDAILHTHLPELRAAIPATMLGGGAEEEGAPASEADDDGGALAGAHPIDTLLLTLPKCASRDKVDALCFDLCYAGLNGAPERLVRALANPPAGRSELLPYYARLAATLHAAGFADVSGPLCAQLLAAFDSHMAGGPRALMALAYVGELCKAGVLPAEAALARLRLAVDGLHSRACAEALCALLDSCGRYLYRAATTHLRTAALLQLALRVKNSRALRDDSDAIIEAAVAQCMPPTTLARAPPEPPLSPLKAYIRQLLSTELNAAGVDGVLSKLRKLRWVAEPELGPFTLGELLRACESRLDALPLVASLVSGLGRGAEEVVVMWVDVLLEHFVAAAARADHRERQLLLCRARLLGEFFNYRVLSSTHIYELLHALVPFARPLPGDWFHCGAHVPPAAADAARAAAKAAKAGAAVAPPPPLDERFVAAALGARERLDDCTRVRLVCAMLDTCGAFLGSGRAKRRLDRFLGYMQLLVLSKRVSVDVEFEVADTLEALRPKLVRHKTLALALADVRKREQRERGDGGGGGEGDGDGDAEGGDDAAGDGDGDGDDDSEGEGGEGYGARGLDEPAHAEIGDGVGARRGSHGLAAQLAPPPPPPSGPTAAEEEEFERLMGAMIVESIETQRSARSGAGAAAVSLPLVTHTSSRPHAGRGEGLSAVIGLQLLSKKGHKSTRAAELHVPVGCSLAQAHLQHEAHEQRERMQLKKLVLQRDFDDDSAPLDTAALYYQAGAANNNSDMLPAMGPRRKGPPSQIHD